MKIGKVWSCFFTFLIACPPAFAQQLDVLPDPFEGVPPKEMTTRYLRTLPVKPSKSDVSPSKV